MKKIIIGLLALASISTYASSSYNCSNFIDTEDVVQLKVKTNLRGDQAFLVVTVN